MEGISEQALKDERNKAGERETGKGITGKRDSRCKVLGQGSMAGQQRPLKAGPCKLVNARSSRSE